jgi:DNA-binding transcriptional LysR family regulator
MNATQLRYVQAVARTGSFTKAAEECFVTQPTLSNGIAQLEDELERRIFSRTTRKVALTEFGESLMPYVEAVLSAERDLLLHAGSFAAPDARRLRVGVSPLTSAGWLGRFVEDFTKSDRDIKIVLHEYNMADLYKLFNSNLLDVIFIVSDIYNHNKQSRFLYQEKLVFIPKNGADPRFASRQSVTIDDIAKDVLVMVPSACGLAHLTRALFRRRRKRLREYGGEAMSYKVLEQWAGLGLGAAILPESKLSDPKSGFKYLVDNNNNNIMIKFEAILSDTNSSQVDKFIKYIDSIA